MGSFAVLPAAATTLPGTILWDQHAVPHIYGPDIPTMVRELGYARAAERHYAAIKRAAERRG
jgi:acyl-homoserine lactone acylase PvdQ